MQDAKGININGARGVVIREFLLKSGHGSADYLLYVGGSAVGVVEAKKEARRDGAAPIELVAGEDLVKLFEDLELGLVPRKTFEIDRKFFDEFNRDA